MHMLLNELSSYDNVVSDCVHGYENYIMERVVVGMIGVSDGCLILNKCCSEENAIATSDNISHKV